MNGKRVNLSNDGGIPTLSPGEYCKCDHGWYAMTPNGHLGNLNGHEVTEHEDGTITVSPSILVTTRENKQDVELWHGYLERGVWRK